MCNIPDYQTRAMPNTFLGNQRKAPPTQIFHLWVFNFYIILTFEYKFDRMHIAIESVEKPKNGNFEASKYLILL